MRVIAEDGRVYLCVEHELGRLERVFYTEDHVSALLGDRNRQLADRVARAVNACASMSDSYLTTLDPNVIAERLVAWDMVVSKSRSTAAQIMQRARTAIEKNGGKL